MAGDRAKPCELDQEKYDADDNVKIICLGDSAVGKSKYVGRLGKKCQAQSGSGLLENSSRGIEEYSFYASGERVVLAGAQVCMGEQGSVTSAAVCVWGGGRPQGQVTGLRKLSFIHESWQKVWDGSP